MIVIYMVTYTAYGVLSSFMDFYNKPRNSRYVIYPKTSISSGEIPLPNDLTDATEKMFIVSSANIEKSTVLVGVHSHDAWIPTNDVDVFVSTDMPIETLSQAEKAVWLSTGYYQLYQNIDPWIETINICGEDYSVAGMADYYFSEETYERMLDTTAKASLLADMELPQPKDEYNNPYDFPNIVATVMLSGSDFSALNVPVAFVEVVFSQSPSYAQYSQMKQIFDPELFEVGEYVATSSGLNFATLSVCVCVAALLFAILLINSLVRFILDSQAVVWRTLYLIGATKCLLVCHMVGMLAIVYLLAAGIAAIPSFLILRYMAEIQVSIPIDWSLGICMSCIAVTSTLLASLPVCLSSACRYSREEGVYVQTI